MEDIKRDVGTFVETYVTRLASKVSSAFPDDMRESSPCATVDVIAAPGTRNMQLDLMDLLIRISIISGDVEEIDSLTDDLKDALKNHPNAFTTVHYGGIHDVSPIMELFIEKEKFRAFVREIDIKARSIEKR
jgi:hypothetical protein